MCATSTSTSTCAIPSDRHVRFWVCYEVKKEPTILITGILEHS